MAAPQIPNLNTLRSARAPNPNRRPGPAASAFYGGAGVEHDRSAEAADKIVQQTDQDAFQSRRSAIALGYIDDDDGFSTELAQDRASEAPPPRRYPIINRGTYVRAKAIDRLVRAFIEETSVSSQPKQILSLGAGSDTRFFRLRKRYPDARILYHELDFAAITSQKVSSIQSSALLRSMLKDVTVAQEGTSLASDGYNIHPVDLRSLVSDESSVGSRSKLLDLPNFSTSMPTLVLSECCLVYLPPSSADALLKHISQTVSSEGAATSMILYEPIRPFDAFGRVMISNLATRGIVLQTLKKYSSLSRQRQRLLLAGYADGQRTADIDFICEHWIPEDEKSRIDRLEMLDEVEEWRLLAQHYCVAWGWRNGKGLGADVFGKAWNDLISQTADDEPV